MTVIISGANYYVQSGPFKHTPQPINYIVFLFWLYFHFMNFFAIPIQFVYRYLVLCKSIKVSNMKFLCFFIPPVVWVLCHTVFFSVNFKISGNDSMVATELLKDWFLESGESDIYLTSLGKSGDFWTQMVSVEALFAMGITYSIIFFCMVKMHIFLRKANSQFSTKTKAMHKSFTRLLFIQGFMPIFSSIGPTFLVCYINVIKGTLVEPTIVLIFLDAWLPVTNAFFTLLVFKPFRIRTLTFLKTRSFKALVSTTYNRSTNAVHPASGYRSRTNFDSHYSGL
ncbi:hypothetical protein FO519_003024 [Halicephalobus sp. NKZ332]|nr:hypothetical protein FO519_003024 [Halicephalobus sp. NKZ332]